MEASPRQVEPMAQNTTVENTHPASSPTSGTKRKAADDALPGQVSSEEKENGRVGKKKATEAPVASSSTVELKNRKLIFKQSPLTINLPRRRLLNFEGYLLDEMDEGRTVTTIPEEHWGLIAQAGHELTSFNETIFVKQVKAALNVVKGGQDPLPNDTLSRLIPKIFTLKQYGFLPYDFASTSTQPIKIPSALQIRCWEANDLAAYFPAEQLEALRARQREREKAREGCVRILEGLDDVEKCELVRGEKRGKEKGKEENKGEDKMTPGRDVKEMSVEVSWRASGDNMDLPASSVQGSSPVKESMRGSSPVKAGKMTPEEEEVARVEKEEKEAKKAALAEQKAIKDRQKKKKTEAVAKQAQAMSMFFKSKPAAASPVSRASPAGPSTPTGKEPSAEAKASPAAVSDYAKSFRPMAKRAHVRVAEINRWVKPVLSAAATGDESPQNQKAGGVEKDAEEETAVDGWSSQDFIRDHLTKHNLTTRCARPPHLPEGLKSAPPAGSVADVLNVLQDAEDPRLLMGQLRNRRKFPWKTLAFDQQARPPYCGTFTKKSLVVGPRTPFAHDPLFDYSYDSSDDWDDDEGGEDVDDFGGAGANPGEDEDDEDDEDEGEFDDWLDDSEDVGGEGPGGMGDPMDLDGPGRPGAGLGARAGVQEQARLPMKVVRKAKEPVKKFVKLVPTWKGPIWEKEIGEKGGDGLEAYRIQLLNDTPVSIDPFTYISNDPIQRYKGNYTTAAIGLNLEVRCLYSSESVAWREPAAPAPTATTTDAPRPPPRGSKTSFPPSHLPELLRLIDGNSKSRLDLIVQLREQFEKVATKVSIENKVREVAVREGRAKDSAWRVFKEAWVAAGVTPPEHALPAPVAAPASGPTATTTAVNSTTTASTTTKLLPSTTPALDATQASPSAPVPTSAPAPAPVPVPAPAPALAPAPQPTTAHAQPPCPPPAQPPNEPEPMIVD